MKPVKKTSKHEIRVLSAPQTFEVRKDARTGARTISGYFATFGTLSNDLGGFVERLQPGAFSQSIKDSPECLCYFNHNADLILGKVSSGTLQVAEDGRGLKFKVTLPDTSYANDLITLMERGDVNSCSFGFSVIQDDWQMLGDQLVRTLIAVKLWEGSIVGLSAYPDTIADLRSCPTQLRSMLNGKSVLGLDAPDAFDDSDDTVTPDDSDEQDEEEEERCSDPRCAYRCALHSHLAGSANTDDESERAAHIALLMRRLR